MSSRSRAAQAIHTTRRGAVWALLPALVLALLTFVPMSSPAQAAGLCFFGASGAITCPDDAPAPTVTEPASLLSLEAYRSMTPGQAAAMRRFEARAVETVIKGHGLPPGDAIDVRNWASDEATGVLQLLVLGASETTPGLRTPDQQLVADWMGDWLRIHTKPAMLQAAAEYALWAGFSVDRYWELVNSGASRQELTTFLERTPQPYSGATPATSTGGYCKYVPPAPYANEYQGRSWQTCFTPCTMSIESCQPPVTFDAFVRWGQARVRTDTDGFRDEAAYLAGAMTAAGWFLYGASDAGMTFRADAAIDLLADIALPDPTTWPDSLTDELVKTFFDEKGTKMVIKDVQGTFELATARIARALPNLIGVDEALVERANILYDHAQDTLRVIRKSALEVAKVARTGFGFSAEIVIFALTTAVEATIKLVEDEELAGRLASKASFAIRGDFDPIIFKALPNGDAALRLRSLFAQAVATGKLMTACGDQCPAAPPVRAATTNDPRFLVHRMGDPMGATQTTSLRLGNVVGDQWVPTYARVSGSWFVETWHDPNLGPTTQSLRLHYTNWNMKPETAWLLRDAGGKYMFRVVSPEKTANFKLETCKVDHTCWTSSSIAYLNAEGNPMLASLEGYQPPTGTPSASPAAPQVGQAVTFDAGHFAPGGARLEVTYKWRFQQGGCGTPCVTYINEQPEPQYGTTVAGRNVTHTWREPGTYQVELTATDGDGRRAVTTMNVTVT